MLNEPLLISMISSSPQIEAAYLLGSAAKKTMRPDSDVDVAILAKKGVLFSNLEQCELSANLAFALGYIVDVGILSSGNLVYTKEALLTGRCIFKRDQFAVDMAVTSLLAMYLNFNEDRKEVLNAYNDR